MNQKINDRTESPSRYVHRVQEPLASWYLRPVPYRLDDADYVSQQRDGMALGMALDSKPTHSGPCKTHETVKRTTAA